MAIHIFHQPVHSARTNMKMASCCCCFLEFDSSGELVAHPGAAFVSVPSGSRNKFEVGQSTSCDEVRSLVQSPPMCCASSLSQ